MNAFLLNIYVCVFYDFLFPALQRSYFGKSSNLANLDLFLGPCCLWREGSIWSVCILFQNNSNTWNLLFQNNSNFQILPLSKQFLHFIHTVTTLNTQRFKRKWCNSICLLTPMIIFFWPSSKSDSIAMNFKQLVNSVILLLWSIYDNM